jgi:hypothetical protein
MIQEIVADLKARDSNAVMDDDFARDIEEWDQGATPAMSPCKGATSPPPVRA